MCLRPPQPWCTTLHLALLTCWVYPKNPCVVTLKFMIMHCWLWKSSWRPEIKFAPLWHLVFKGMSKQDTDTTILSFSLKDLLFYDALSGLTIKTAVEEEMIYNNCLQGFWISGDLCLPWKSAFNFCSKTLTVLIFILPCQMLLLNQKNVNYFFELFCGSFTAFVFVILLLFGFFVILWKPMCPLMYKYICASMLF